MNSAPRLSAIWICSTEDPQLDDTLNDKWPGVAGDGTVVWMGKGSYPGTRSAASDFEIFLARPAGPVSRGRHRLPWIAGMTVALGLAAVAIVWRRRR